MGDLLRKTSVLETFVSIPHTSRSSNLLFGIILFTSCGEQVQDFIFDASKTSERTTFTYQYDTGRVTSQVSTFHVLMFGEVVDSMVTEKKFTYNAKGQLIREEEKTDFNEKPTIKEYHYASNDSLICELTIRPEGDTIYWEVYDYYPDGKRTVFKRVLFRHFDPKQNFQNLNFSRYDTIQQRNEFDYAGDKCQMQREYDQRNRLIRVIDFKYANMQLIKETHSTYLDDHKMIDKTKFFDFSKSSVKPDFYALDYRGDTVEINVNLFKHGSLTARTEVYDYGDVVLKTFFEDSKEIGNVNFDRRMNRKHLVHFEYFENGQLRETKSYFEDLVK